MSSMTRRLPIYLLLDTSESMVGEPMDAVNQGLQQICLELKSDPMAIETAWLSVITFGGTARQVCGLTDILQFSAPKLTVGPGTNLGAALNILGQSIQREVHKTSAEQKGDWKPLIFLLTDGRPTDSWQDALTRFKATISRSPSNVIAIGCGDDVDLDVLRAISPVTLLMKHMSSGSMKEFFKWVSTSVSTVSMSVATDGRGLNLPTLPRNALEAAGTTCAPRSPAGALLSQVILLAKCQQGGYPYLMRYRRSEGSGGVYAAENAYPVGSDYLAEVSAGPAGQAIDAANLQGAPACPYCGRPGWRPTKNPPGLECSDRLELRSNRAQVMFVLDITGSMGGEIDGVKQNMKEFMDYIHSEGLSVEVGLIAFRDLEEREPPETLSFEGRPFTSDAKDFKRKVSRLSANGGGGNPGESSFDALVLACRQPFAEGVTRILILVTDEPPLVPDGEVRSVKDVLRALERARIDQLHMVLPNDRRLRGCFAPLQKQVKGEIFPLGTGRRGGEAFRKVLLDIGKSISIATRVG